MHLEYFGIVEKWLLTLWFSPPGTRHPQGIWYVDSPMNCLISERHDGHLSLEDQVNCSRTHQKAARTGTGFRSRRPRRLACQSGLWQEVPPQSRDLEARSWGDHALTRMPCHGAGILNPESFYVDAHQEIFKGHSRCSSTPSPSTCSPSPKSSSAWQAGRIGGYQLVELTNRVASSANIEFHARIVAQKFIRRMDRSGYQCDHPGSLGIPRMCSICWITPKPVSSRSRPASPELRAHRRPGGLALKQIELSKKG